ncbi:MAG: lytic murein transglycosylase [Bdellovibrionales bacterium]
MAFKLERGLVSNAVNFLLIVISVLGTSSLSSAYEETFVKEFNGELIGAFLERAEEAKLDVEYVKGALERASFAKLTKTILDRRSSLKDEADPGKWTKHFKNYERWENGKVFYNEHKDILESVGVKYHLPPYLLAAFVGVESLYCANMGDIKIIDALATAAFFEHRRQELFNQELLEYFLLMQESDSELYSEETRGSFAGAMGCGQFMPSSIRKFAVDVDGDGLANVFDPVEMIHSIGKFIGSENLWVEGQEFLLPTNVVDEDKFRAFQRTTPETGWQTLGWRSSYFMDGLRNEIGLGLSGNASSPSSYEKGSFSLIRLRHELGDLYFAGGSNFYAITRYNNSTRYSVTVYLLSRLIEGVKEGDRDYDLVKSLLPKGFQF